MKNPNVLLYSDAIIIFEEDTFYSRMIIWKVLAIQNVKIFFIDHKKHVNGPLWLWHIVYRILYCPVCIMILFIFGTLGIFWCQYVCVCRTSLTTFTWVTVLHEYIFCLKWISVCTIYNQTFVIVTVELCCSVSVVVLK